MNKKRKIIFINELINNDNILFKISEHFLFVKKLLLKKYKKYTYNKDKTAFIPNLIHSIDANIVFLILRYLFFSKTFNNMCIFVIHDSFGTQYNDIKKIKEAFNKATLYLIKNLNYYDIILNSNKLQQFKIDFNLYRLNASYNMLTKILDIELKKEKEQGIISNRDSENIKIAIHYYLKQLDGISLEKALLLFEEIKKDEKKLLLLQNFDQQYILYNKARNERIEFCKNEKELIKELFLTAIE